MMTKEQYEALVQKESERFAKRLSGAVRLNVGAETFVKQAMKNKRPLAELLGGYRRHVTVTVAHEVQQSDVESCSGGWLTCKAIEWLAKGPYAPESTTVGEMVEHWEYTRRTYSEHFLSHTPDLTIRKGQRILAALTKAFTAGALKEYEANEAKFPQYTYTKEQWLRMRTETITRLGEHLGQLYAVSGEEMAMHAQITLAPSTFAALGTFGCDSGSCYRNGHESECSKWALALHPHTFVVLVYDTPSEAAVNSTRSGNVLARAWGFMGIKNKGLYVNNIYSSELPYELIHSVIRKSIEQLTGWTLHTQPRNSVPYNDISNYVYVNNSDKHYAEDGAALGAFDSECIRAHVAGLDYVSDYDADDGDDQIYCADCGYHITGEEHYCTNCGEYVCSAHIAEIDAGARYECTRCAAERYTVCAHCSGYYSEVTECSECNEQYCVHCAPPACPGDGCTKHVCCEDKCSDCVEKEEAEEEAPSEAVA